MAEAVEAVRLGFREWGENPQLNAPRRRIHIPTGVRVSVPQGGVPNLNIPPVASPEEAVRGVDIILTATNSSVPVFDGNWLDPGQHVTTIVGSNVGLVKGGFTAAKRREIDDATLARSHVHGIVSIQQAIQDEQADIYDPVERGVIRWEQLIEIGEILAGNKEGRTKAEEIPFYNNNAGQGVADVALGAAVLEKIKAKNTGQKLELE